MGILKNLANKVKQTAQKAVSKVAKTNFGKKVVEAVKKAAPVAKAVVKSTPQYQAVKNVQKAVSYAPVAATVVKSIVSKPKSSDSNKSSNKTSSFTAKVAEVKNNAVKSLPKASDVFQTKAYASDSEPAQQSQQKSFAEKLVDAVFAPQKARDDLVNKITSGIKYYGKGNWLNGLLPEFGATESVLSAFGLNPNYQSVENAKLRNQGYAVANSGEILANPLPKSVSDYFASNPGDAGAISQYIGSFTPTTTTSTPNTTTTTNPNVLTKPTDTTNNKTNDKKEDMPAYSPGQIGAVSPGGEWVYTGGGVTGWERVADNTQTTTNTLPQPQPQPTTITDPVQQILNNIDPNLAVLLGEDVTGNKMADELIKLQDSNYANSEDFVNRWNENQRQRLELAYKRLLENYNNLSDEEKVMADRALDEIRRNLDVLYQDAESAKQSVENAYNEAERARIKSDRLEEAKMRNLFSSLGTAESSSFIEKLMDLKQQQGSDIYKAKTEKAGKLADITNLVNREKAKLESDKNDILTTRDRNIQAIRRNMLLSEEEKDAAIQEQNLNALLQLLELQKQNWANKLSILNNRDAYRGELLAALAPGIMQDALLRKYAIQDNSYSGYGNQNYQPRKYGELIPLNL